LLAVRTSPRFHASSPRVVVVPLETAPAFVDVFELAGLEVAAVPVAPVYSV
jgi:hypothetical protein